MFSDRGTNFVGADAELKAALCAMEHHRIRDFSLAKGWERLVRLVKTALKTTLKECVPREEVLITLLAEAEMMINSRPLTYVSSDPDGPVALTPKTPKFINRYRFWRIHVRFI